MRLRGGSALTSVTCAQVMELAKQGFQPRKIVNRESFEDAVIVHAVSPVRSGYME